MFTHIRVMFLQNTKTDLQQFHAETNATLKTERT